jgi:NAD+ synthase
MDRVLYAYNLGLPAADAAPRLGLEAEQVERAFRDLERKRGTTRYLHMPPLLVDDVVLDGARVT